MKQETKCTMGTWLALLRFGLTAGTAFGLVLSLTLFPWITPNWWPVLSMIIVIAAMPAGMAIALYLPIDRITVAAFRTMARWAAVFMGASFGCSLGIAFGAIGAGTGALLGGCISYTEFRRGEKHSAGLPTTLRP